MRLRSAPLDHGTTSMGSATVDQLMHHAHIFMTAGDSIRLTQATRGNGVTTPDHLTNQADQQATSGQNHRPPMGRTQWPLTRS